MSDFKLPKDFTAPQGFIGTVFSGLGGLFKKLEPNLIFIFGHVLKLKTIVLIPVFAITAMFLAGLSDSGFLDTLFGFLSDKLAMLQSSAYCAGKSLPNMNAFMRCFE